ncbi:hypothetical protein [Dietzia sp. MNB45]|uniref:hypothetical protein n=1 Tax=Dietzia sp. MNB45 TaxID=3238800 RepID=UPI003F7D8762
MSKDTDELRRDIEHTILAWSSMTTGEQRTKLHSEADQFVLMLMDLFHSHTEKQIDSIIAAIQKYYGKGLNGYEERLLDSIIRDVKAERDRVKQGQ